jgi:protein farnesyltransferase subunit beta
VGRIHFGSKKQKIIINIIMTIVHTPQLQHKSTTTVQETVTTREQLATERECAPYLVDIARLPESQKDHLRATGHLQTTKKKNDATDDNDNDGETERIGLLTDLHVAYLQGIWERPLRATYVSLDASRPWMIYWCLHGCDLLGRPCSSSTSSSSSSPNNDVERTVAALKLCWNKNNNNDGRDTNNNAGGGGGGGFGGGVDQLPHAATTYAAVLALCILASSCHSTAALAFLQEIRPDLHSWFHTTLIDATTGAVRMHDDGEIDVRASYCVVAVAKLLNLAVPSVLVQFCQQCQTWEGGFGGEPGTEAHGGYAFCAVATLHLLLANAGAGASTVQTLEDVIDVDALRSWLVRRQLSYEGGFSGRTNKLVDGCYSFWQGGALALVEQEYDYPMLERYVLLCGQDTHGGLRDKPSKGRDFYHSCYCLSGLSIAVHRSQDHFGSVEIGKTHPAFNIQTRHVEFIQAQFASCPI